MTDEPKEELPPITGTLQVGEDLDGLGSQPKPPPEPEEAKP